MKLMVCNCPSTALTIALSDLSRMGLAIGKQASPSAFRWSSMPCIWSFQAQKVAPFSRSVSACKSAMPSALFRRRHTEVSWDLPHDLAHHLVDVRRAVEHVGDRHG